MRIALKHWELHAGDKDLALALKKSFQSLYKQNPADYRFDLCDASLRFLPKKNDVHYAIGHDIDNLLGFAHCTKRGPSDVGDISCLPNFWRGRVYNQDLQKVKRSEFSKYDGYAQYSGNGSLLHIWLLEAFKRNCGVGSSLIDFIKSRNYELIEVDCINGAENFYSKKGFVRSGLSSSHDLLPVMVWNKR